MDLRAMNERIRRSVRRYFELVTSDAIVVIISLWLAWSVRAVTTTLLIEPVFLFTLICILIYWLSNFLFRLYHRIWKYASAVDVIPIAISSMVGTGIVVGLDLVWEEPHPLPLSVVLITGFLCFIGFITVRYRRRFWIGLQWRWNALLGRKIPGFERVLIVGAGEAGEILARRLSAQKEGKRYQLVGFVDDDPSKHQMRLHDLQIFGDHRQIPELVVKHNIELIVIAIYNITGDDFRSILEACEKTVARIKVIPDLMEFLQDRQNQPSIRDISSEDLLGRKMIEIDESSCRELIRDRRILVTGAAGSIGSELCRQILKFEPKQLLLLDNNESGLYELHNELERLIGAGNQTRNPVKKNANHDPLLAIVASVTNRSKLSYLFEKHQPEIVFHAAAYKHVPMMEEQPDEALWVNVCGVKNLVELSKEYQVERFVFVSTDKSVQPVCIMGATKWLGELMMMHPDAWARRLRNLDATERRTKQRRSFAPRPTHNVEGMEVRPETLFTAVRFGNVLGSRGSVVPTFEQQIRAGGPVMVTHPDMTRYFMSITEAVRLIIQAATFTHGRDIFMLNMGERIKIDDLARRLIRLRGARPGIDVKIVYSGIRPGEKMHEELLGPTESRLETKHKCIFRIRKNHAPIPEVLSNEIDHLLILARDHRNDEVARRLQAFVAKEEGQQPGGLMISYKGKISELIPAAQDAERQGDWNQALSLYGEALQLTEGLQYRRADLLCWIANVYRKQGDLIRAKESNIESQEISRKSGYISGLVSAARSLGEIAVDSENYKLALRHFHSALRLSGQYKYDDQKGEIFEQMGNVYEKQGRHQKAFLAYRRALKHLPNKSDLSRNALLLSKLGSCCLKLDRLQTSERYLLQSAALLNLLDDKNAVVSLDLQLARLYLQKKEFQKARERGEKALEIITQSGSKKRLAEAYLLLGMILRREKSFEQAEEQLGKAFAFGQEANAILIKGDAQMELSLLYLDFNQVERALKSISQATSEYLKISTNGELKEVKGKTPALEKLFLEIAKEFGQANGCSNEHSWLVALYCLEIADWIGLAPDQKKALVTAAFLHDIGEKQVSREILQKVAPLSMEERDQIKQHVMHSARMIEEIHFPWPEVLAYVKYHHERFNGEGYPLGLRGEEIHLGARILALSDYFAALIADRPHRKAFSFAEAFEMVRSESGRMFDPKLVEIFLQPELSDKLTMLARYQQSHSDVDRLWPRVDSSDKDSAEGKSRDVAVDASTWEAKKLRKEA